MMLVARADWAAKRAAMPAESLVKTILKSEYEYSKREERKVRLGRELGLASRFNLLYTPVQLRRWGLSMSSHLGD